MQQESNSEKVRFVVGLGNPGRRYGRTRHNVGFAVADALASRWGASEGRRAFEGRLVDARPTLAGRQRRVMLFQPHTFMNLSGSAVGQLASFYKADRGDVLVVLDDLALPLGQLRVRGGGSSGGHKGLADVLGALGGEEVPRLRIGIGSPPAGVDATDFVLKTFNACEQQTADDAVARAAQAVEDWIVNGLTYVMDTYNRRTES